MMDIRKVSDLHQIRLGNEIYYDMKSFYAARLSDLKTEGAISEILFNSRPGQSYDYCATNDKQNFGLGVQLKQVKSPSLNSGIEQFQMPCSPNPQKICGSDGYFCVNNNINQAY